MGVIKFHSLFYFLFISISFISNLKAQSGNIYRIQTAKVEFKSEAPKEEIYASSVNLIGVMDVYKKTFAFAIPMNSFLGFNNELQREHYNENYVESSKYPKAIFTGSLNKNIDLESNTSIEDEKVIGKIKLHGVEKETAVNSTIKVSNNKIQITSEFEIVLSDFKIEIPKVVEEKLSNLIKVKVFAELVPKG